MSPDTYRMIAELTGGWARGLHLRPIPIQDVHRARVGVGLYLACRADGVLLYVGSAARPADPHGVAHRISEHRLARRAPWHEVWILPLHDDTPPAVVRAIEGQVIDLLRPLQNQRRHRARPIPWHRGRNG